MQIGHIYKIVNDINNKIYIGQTSRDIDIRFNEHCTEIKGHSKLHHAIQKYGRNHFQIEEIEQVPIDKLDEREKYWIKYYNSTNDDRGYNISLGGKGNFATRDYSQIVIIENNIVFDSKEQLARLMSQVTSWSLRYLKSILTKIIDTDKDFLGYHLKSCFLPIEQVSDENIQIDWIKTLNIQHQGTKIYCVELDKEFETIGQAAKFCVNNNLSSRSGVFAINTITTDISKYIRNPSVEGIPYISNYHFYKIPGSTKNAGSKYPFQKRKVFCPELNMTFESQKECAEYLINNNIWTNIKLKTAILKISNVVNNDFPSYKGYSFQRIE